MIKIYPYEKLGKFKISWLEANYHFSFSKYYNPQRTGFGKLLVINDDRVKAGTGFETHPHRDMEIITYVRSGAITHKDSEGNEGRTEAGDIQVMSAGTGIFHSEHNLEKEDTTMYQIWIEPNVMGIEPSWSAIKFPKECNGDNIPLLVSGNKKDCNKNTLHINQQAAIYGGRLSEGKTITHRISNQIYILLSEGTAEIDGKLMKKGDGCEITKQTSTKIKALSEIEVVIIDVPD